MSNKAKFDLDAVFKLVKERRVYFSARSRSILTVLKVYEKSGFIKTQAAAENFILDAILTLNADYFYQRVIQWNDPKCVADVYGLILGL